MSASEEEDDFEIESSLSCPMPYGVVDISYLATWTVSSAKLGNGVENLLDFSTDTYWQSDDFPPHVVTLRFRSFTIVTHLMILTSDTDDSYNPKLVKIRAGTEEEEEFMPLTLVDSVQLYHGWNKITTFSESGWGEPEVQPWSSRQKKRSGLKERITRGQCEFTGGQKSLTNSEALDRGSDSGDEETDEEEDKRNVRDKFIGCTKMKLVVEENHSRGRDCRIRGMRVLSFCRPIGYNFENI